MTKIQQPRKLEDIDLSWLNYVLNPNRLPNLPSATSYSTAIIGEGKGFMNQISRVTIKYESQDPTLPASVIIKFASEDQYLKHITQTFRTDQREIKFYEGIAPTASLDSPRIYFSDIDEQTGDTLLVIEDLINLRQGDSVQGCSLNDARVAIDQIARFHSSWWQNPALMELDWLPLRSNESELYHDIYPDAWELLKVKAGQFMTTRLLDLGQVLRGHIGKIKTHLTKRPRTITHGDYRLDNLFFRDNVSQRPLVVFDWEYCSIGRGTFDVATFINEAFTPKLRRNHEIALLAMYHALLLESGVDDYTFEECLIDYRISILEIFIFWVVVGGYCDYEDDRGSAYLANACEKFNASIHDLDCTALIST
ncbi:uncharacterized protein METZ01_LOCUS220151 [marine metagenome]|uniref:CHK kinase-like domain-containing protein n=1 Tax=marine metagenome TaxID=408172 RepID=A0A382FYH5_9ZZZZ